MDLRAALQSAVAVTVTPFDSSDQIDEAAFTGIIGRMVTGGVRAITTNGNAGEYYALSASEVDRCIELAVSASAGAVVIGGVDHSVALTVAAARAAEAVGGAAVMIHQPVRFARIVSEVPEGRLTWICGLAELSAPFFHLAGATGFTSGLATIAPSLSVALHDRLSEGDRAGARDLWAKVRPLEEMRARDASADNVSVVKEALAVPGLCRREVRPPSSELSAEDREAVARWVAAVS